jgi:hypothetical protein
MNARRYRERVAEDLERWIAAGWVPAASRGLILADLPADPPGRTTLWLGMIGATLGGLAVIAGVADNWAIIPRALKLALLLALLWAAVGGGAWAGGRTKPNITNALTLVAALIFAASVGLLGQSLNIPGDPGDVFLAAALGTGLLALAGASPAAGVVYLVFAAVWYWNNGGEFDFGPKFLTHKDLYGALFLVGGFVGAAALKSRVLAHASLLLAGPFALIIAYRAIYGDASAAYSVAAAWGVIALIGYLGVRMERAGAGVVLGWGVWHGLAAFGFAGFGHGSAILHRVLWMGVSIAVIALVARARQSWSLAAGVISLAVACFTILVDLGLGLGNSALIFGSAALVVLALALLLRRRAEAG